MPQTWRANKAIPASARLPVGLTSTKHRRIAVQSCCGWKKPIIIFLHKASPLLSREASTCLDHIWCEESLTPPWKDDALPGRSAWGNFTQSDRTRTPKLARAGRRARLGGSWRGQPPGSPSMVRSRWSQRSVCSSANCRHTTVSKKCHGARAWSPLSAAEGTRGTTPAQRDEQPDWPLAW